jgi:hypothetical protein
MAGQYDTAVMIPCPVVWWFVELKQSNPSLSSSSRGLVVYFRLNIQPRMQLPYWARHLVGMIQHG